MPADAPNRQLKTIRYLNVVAVAMVALYIFWPSGPRAVRGPGDRSVMCRNRMREIATALLHYESVRGEFPPAVVTDENGKPMHSWRVLIMPYMERKDVYDAYDFDEPWDGPNNRKLAEKVNLEFFHCPSTERSDDDGTTDYVLVVGPEAIFDVGKSVSQSFLAEHDGADSTIMLIETKNSGIHWMEPRDLTIDEAVKSISPGGQGTNHTNSINVAFAGGSVRRLSTDATPETFRALLTAAGGETLDEDAY